MIELDYAREHVKKLAEDGIKVAKQMQNTTDRRDNDLGQFFEQTFMSMIAIYTTRQEALSKLKKELGGRDE